MNKVSTLFLQAAIILIGIFTLTFMLWEPHLEGRNASATLSEIYFKDPFLVYVYVASIPFFVALYQAFKILSRIRRNEVFIQHDVQALRTIKYCALATAALIVVTDVYIAVANTGTDDFAGVISISFLAILASIVMATLMGLFERILQDSVDSAVKNT